MASSRFWYVLSFLLACPQNPYATSTLKDLRLRRRRRMQRAAARPFTYSYAGQDSYGSYGASYGGGGNAMKNLFGNSYGGGGKSYSYSYSYSYGDDEFSCLVDPKNASTKGFLCSDGVSCIEGPKSCDGTPDCPDHSDELGCNFECLIQTGSMTGFKCHDGSCAEGGPDGRRMCDGTSDCPDGSDELGCGFECVLPHGGRGIECSNGECIHESYACDGEANCPDGSDEMGCAFQCTTSENIKGWFCSDGTCVAGKHVCDGTSDCAGHEDEMGCGFQCNATAPDGTVTRGWRCDDGSDEHEGTCTTGGQQCDGTSDCPSGSDELGCGLGCLAVDGGLAFECTSKSPVTDAIECIAEELVCNGQQDCTDGSDERGCQFCSPNCPNFYVGDGYCQVACLTNACRYDDGDCDTPGATGAAGVCHQCRASSCEACFDVGIGSCAGPPRRTDGDCAWCKMCEPCATCFPAGGQAAGGADGSDAGGGGGGVSAVTSTCTSPEAVPALARELEELCAAGAFHDPPACASACRAKWTEAKSTGCWLQLVSAAPPALLHTVQQACYGACQDDVDAFGLLFVARCKSGTGSAIDCSLACREVLHAIAGHACATPIRAAMGADAALTKFEQGAQTVEDDRLCSPCSASIVQAVLLPVQQACRELLAMSAAERQAQGACSPSCAAALHAAKADVCYEGGDASDPTSLQGAPLSGAGSDTIAALQQACASLQQPGCSASALEAERVCAPAFADRADQSCPHGCRDALQRANAGAFAPCLEARPGFLDSALTLCRGGCHAYQPVYEGVTRECADELAEDEDGGGRRALEGGRVGGAGRPGGGSGWTERQRAARAKTCSLDCQESLAALNRSVLASRCDADAPLGGQLARLKARCADDAESVRCVVQFEHVVELCVRLSLDSLPSWPASLPCSPDCHGTIAMFQSLACFGKFEAVAQTSGGDHLREAWDRLQHCRVDRGMGSNLEDERGGRAAHVTPPALPPRPSGQPLPPAAPPPRRGRRHPAPPRPSPPPRPPPSDFETLRGVAYGVGYYAGCDVLLDRNGNGRADEGEPVTTTATAASGQPGTFALKIAKTARLPLAGSHGPVRLTVLVGGGSDRGYDSCKDTGTGGPARVPLYAPLPSLPSDATPASSGEIATSSISSSGEIAISPISSVLAHFHDDVSAPEAARLLSTALGLRQEALGDDALRALREHSPASAHPVGDAASVLAAGAQLLCAVALHSAHLAAVSTQQAWRDGDDEAYSRTVAARMHELVSQILERLASTVVAMGLVGFDKAVQVSRWDLSSEVELAELFRSVNTITPGDGAPSMVISSAGPARIAADVNRRLSLAVDELLRQPLALLARLEAIGRVVLGGAGSAKAGSSWLAPGEKPASLGAVGCLGGTRALASATSVMLADGIPADGLPFVGACESDYTGAKLGHKIEAAQRRGAAEVRGCTYDWARNYEPDATADDGSCERRRGGGGLRGGALAAVVLLVLVLVLPWFLLCGAWRLGYLDKCIQRRRGRVRVGGSEAGVTAAAAVELPLSSQQLGSELPYLPPMGAEQPALSRLPEGYPEAEAVVIEEGGGGGLPFAQPLPEERAHDERATAPLVLSDSSAV